MTVFKWTIRRRLMGWVLGVAGAILLIVIGWSYQTSRRDVKREAVGKARYLAEGATDRIESTVRHFEGVIDGLGLALEAHRLDLPFAQARTLQDECLRTNPGILGVCIAVEPDARPPDWPGLAPWAYVEGGELRYEELAGDAHQHLVEDWYTLPKYLGRPVWSEPYEWHDLLMVTYSVPLEVDGRFAGVVTCDVGLDWLGGFLGSLPLGQDGYAVLLSRSGTYISHVLPELVLNESPFSIAEARGDEALRDLAQQMIRGESGVVPFISFATHDASWLAYSPLRSTGWTLACLISQAEMQAELVQLTRTQAAIGAFGLLLLCLAVSLISRGIVRPIKALEEGAARLADGDLDANLPVPHGDDEVAHLTGAFTRMRDDLKEHIRNLRATTAARERMQSELRIAHDIQMGLVPKTFPPFPRRHDLDLYAIIEPAREVGGDFYDFFTVDDNHLVVAIGDVSGKGVPAALFMAVTRSFLRSFFRSDSDPGTVITQANNELAEGNDACMFVTLFAAVIELTTGKVRYANGGHNPPVILAPDGSTELITEPSGPVAGALEGSEYECGETVLPPDHVLLLYTDGVTEAMNHEQELFEEDRLLAALPGLAGSGCQVILEQLLAAISAFVDGAEQSDDITMLAVQRRLPED